MARVKKKVKILKEFVNNQFKEIKKPKTEKVQEEEESSDFEDSHFSGGGFSSNGRRVAPVISSNGNEQSLEQVAGTAPITSSTSSAAGGNVYATNYSSKYDNAKYDNISERPAPPSVRAAGSLVADFDMRGLRRMQTAWQSQDQAQAGGAWDRNSSDELRYQPKADSLKEHSQQIDRRRRMV